MKTADFYSSATGTLRVNGNRDKNAPAGVSLSIDDLSYIKQGSRANENSDSFTPTEAQLAAMNSGITSSDVAQITTNENNISKLTPNYAISVCPVTNDYSCIAALTQTIPTVSIARISATIDKGNTSVRGIILSLTDDISTFNNGDNLLAKDEQSVSDKRILTVDAMYYNGSSSNTIPVYIWVKGEGTGAVMGYSSLEKLK